MAILFGAFAVYKHIITEGLIILAVGMFGLSFYSFRLGVSWKGETDDISSKEEAKE